MKLNMTSNWILSNVTTCPVLIIELFRGCCQLGRISSISSNSLFPVAHIACCKIYFP